MKLLIIEGPDRCGKNTLIKHLASQSDNFVVRHFGSAKGADDNEKRRNQFLFFQKEFELAALRHRFDQGDPVRYPRDLWVWNRAHLGEFVYGKIYRETNPEEWVLQMEKMYGMHLDPSVYLLLLTGSPKLLASRDDGKSFSSSKFSREREIQAFREAFRSSSILNKAEIDVTSDDGAEYIPEAEILQQVNEFLGFE